MAIYHYTLPWVVVSDTGAPIGARSDGALLDIDGNPVTATTSLGVPTLVATRPQGTTLPFQADIPAGRVRFGDVEAAVFSDENLNALPSAEAARIAAENAYAAVQHIGETAAEITYLYRLGEDVWVSDTPVVEGGGKPRVDPVTGDVWVDFPV